MKYCWMLSLLVLVSCASKTAYYPVLQKSEYLKERSKPAHSGMSLVKGKSYQRDICRGQFLFFNNAAKETEQALASQIRYICPRQDYLLETKIKKVWWTTLIYSRSCVDIKAYCPYVKAKK